MSYRDLAKRIKTGFNDLKNDETFKTCNIIRNDKLISEITVENDAEFKAIIIGDTTNNSKSRGYMYLFYTNDRNIPFPSIKEIERRLRIVANKEIFIAFPYMPCRQILSHMIDIVYLTCVLYCFTDIFDFFSVHWR